VLEGDRMSEGNRFIGKTVPELMRAAAATYEERNKLYGDNYKKFGGVMLALFPDGPPDLVTKMDWNRFGVFFQIASKVTRYAENLTTGGHRDSAHDISVYGAMLEELTEEGLAAVRARPEGVPHRGTAAGSGNALRALREPFDAREVSEAVREALRAVEHALDGLRVHAGTIVRDVPDLRAHLARARAALVSAIGEEA
jgi:hypothetical protein